MSVVTVRLVVDLTAESRELEETLGTLERTLEQGTAGGQMCESREVVSQLAEAIRKIYNQTNWYELEKRNGKFVQLVQVASGETIICVDDPSQIRKRE